MAWKYNRHWPLLENLVNKDWQFPANYQKRGHKWWILLVKWTPLSHQLWYIHICMLSYIYHVALNGNYHPSIAIQHSMSRNGGKTTVVNVPSLVMKSQNLNLPEHIRPLLDALSSLSDTTRTAYMLQRQIHTSSIVWGGRPGRLKRLTHAYDSIAKSILWVSTLDISRKKRNGNWENDKTEAPKETKQTHHHLQFIRWFKFIRALIKSSLRKFHGRTDDFSYHMRSPASFLPQPLGRTKFLHMYLYSYMYLLETRIGS